VVIVGTGALGSVISMTLAQAGVGHIVLIDMDTVEISNLNRQLIFQESDIGERKAVIAQKHLEEINSEIRIDAIPKRVQELPLSTYSSPTDGIVVIIDALDNFEARRWLNSVAIAKNLPLVSGGMFASLGNVQIIIPGKTPCLECQPLIPERELQKACTPPGEVRQALEEEKKLDIKLDEKDEDLEFFPALGSVATVIGGIMTHETLKLLQNTPQDKIMSDFLFIDLDVLSFLSVPLARRQNCIVCSSRFKLEGIPFHFDVKENLGEVRKRIALQFNLNLTTIELTHQARTLENADSKQLREIITNDNPKIYVIAPELPLPLKLALFED
jgi:molybdopterin/thiamine biosynthesis adenylyltransferase